MDYITSSSALSFDQIEEMFQFSSSVPYQDQCQVLVDELDEILNAPSPPSWNVLVPEDNLGACPLPHPVEPPAVPPGSTPVEHRKPTPEINKKRKVVHRDVERQRRQEMTSLYGSLRSRLPPHLLKGKRSISDHIHQATGYIKNIQRRIQELSDKRDDLKRTLETNKSGDLCNNKIEIPPACHHQDTVVKMEPCIGGVETTIITDLRHGMRLSEVLGFLIREGMIIISCTSTVVNEALLHSITSEVITDDVSETDKLSVLKAKLMSLSREF